MSWIRSHLAPRVQPIAPPPPWEADLIGEESLRQIEQRRQVISHTIQHFRQDVDASMRDEIDAIRREQHSG